MNIKNHLIEIQCGHRDVTDVAQALIHSLIFFRTHGKFNYKHEGSYSIGTLGYERAVTTHLDFSYIRCSSLTLVNRINNKIQEVVSKLNEFSQSVTLALEFYTRRPNRWPFNDSKIVWELWNIKLVINNPFASSTSSPTGDHSNQQRNPSSNARLEDVLSQKLLDIVRIVNNDKHSLPQMPTQLNLDNVFDTSHAELQPYLYSISYKISENVPGVQSASRGVGKYSDANVLSDSSTQSSLKKFLLGTLEL